MPIVQAQDNRPLIDTNMTLYFTVIAGIAILTVVIMDFCVGTATPPPENFTSTSVLVKPDEETEQYILDSHSPIVLENGGSHAPIQRP